MSLITFDWAQIAYIGSPLATPWWAEANVAAGFVFFFCERELLLPFLVHDSSYPGIITPILYYTNVWDLGNSRIHVFVLLAYNYIYLTSAIRV